MWLCGESLGCGSVGRVWGVVVWGVVVWGEFGSVVVRVWGVVVWGEFGVW